jgi:hypothetical protein
MPTSTSSTSFGYRTTISSPFTPAEATAWFADVKRVVGKPHTFGQLVDLRGQKTTTPESNAIVESAMEWVRAQGMNRSAVVLSSAITKMTIMRLAKEAGMYAYERYFDASSDPAWETKALAWLEHGTDPDA